LLSLFFNHTPTSQIYTLSLHDALPISTSRKKEGLCSNGACSSLGWPSGWYPSRPRLTSPCPSRPLGASSTGPRSGTRASGTQRRSEEHTSELQSRRDLVCRLLLEKKKK